MIFCERVTKVNLNQLCTWRPTFSWEDALVKFMDVSCSSTQIPLIIFLVLITTSSDADTGKKVIHISYLVIPQNHSL